MGIASHPAAWRLLSEYQVVATLLIAVNRQSTAPFGALAIVSSLSVARIALLAINGWKLHAEDIPSFMGLILALLATGIILCMPFRRPSLNNDLISEPYTPPTNRLRSPEDNLTVWQFISVSWMSPLISLGSARQLNDEDIWILSFEFQHKMLHEFFRVLKGTVVKRLLKANGLDLVIISALGIVSSLASR